MSLKIKYYDIPVGAQSDMTAQGQGQPFSRGEDLVSGGEDKSYATLENGIWKLDGSCKLLPDAPEGFWWSKKLSDKDGVFAEPPVLELTFSKPYTATGFTFSFWPSQNQFCSQMEVTWLRQDAMLFQSVVHPDRPRWTQNQTVEGFDKIRIKLQKTNQPFQFAKIQKLEIGRVLQFERGQVESVSLLNEADHMLCTLSADTMTVKLCLRDGEVLLPQENQRLELYENGRLAARQYITGSSRHSQWQYSVQSQSAVGLLEDTFLGGFYEKKPLHQLLEELLPDWPVTVHKNLKNRTVSGYLGVCTRREALQQIAFAVGAVVMTQGSEGFRILPQEQVASGKISNDKIFTGGDMEIAQRYARIDVSVHTYTPNSDRKTLLDQVDFSGEDNLITFTEPYHSYEIQGGILTESGSNHVKITASGPVTLTAQGYSHTQTLHSWNDTGATGTELRNVLTIDQATLIGDKDVEGVLQRLRELTENRQKLRIRAVIDGQQVGDMITAQNPWGTQTQGYVTAMDSVFTDRGHTADILIWGKEAPGKIACYYSGDYFAGEEVLYG